MKLRRNTVIESLGVYLPAHTLTTDEVMKACRQRVNFPLKYATGISLRHVADKAEFSIDLAIKAVAECLALSRYRVEDIDLLLCCNISRFDGPNRFSFEPSTAMRLRRDFGFSCDLALDISNACAGVFTGIAIADAFLKVGQARRAMVVSGEYITHLTETAQRELTGFLDPRLACLTLGDSGIALILESGFSDTAGLFAMELYTLGRYSDACIARASERPTGGAIMLTDVVKLASVAVDEAASHAVEMQKRIGWPPELLNHVIMHQTSERTIKEAMERFNRLYGQTICTAENVVSNVRRRANTATTSHFVAFNDRVLSGDIRSGDNIVFSVNASGLTIGTAAYRCDDLPDRMRRRARSESPEDDASRGQTIVEGSLSARPILSNPAVRIESIGIVDEDDHVRRDTVALSCAAAEQCLQQSRHDRSEIELLIYAGIYRTAYICEPAIAAMIAGDLALNHDRKTAGSARTLCFDILGGAAGFLAACLVASSAIVEGRVRRAMIVTSEIDSNAAMPDRDHVGLEETASALILESSSTDREGFGEIRFRYFTEHLDAFTSYCDLNVPSGVLVVDRTADLEARYIDCLCEAIEAFLVETQVDRTLIDFVLAPQISSDFLKALSSRLGLKAPCVDATTGRKNLYTSSFPVALKQAHQLGLIKCGAIGLILEVGAGIQVGCALYHC